MDKRLDGKVAIVTGAGQTPGDTIGNGRAISLLFARAGAKTMLVDFRLDSAQETQSMIGREGGESIAFAAVRSFLNEEGIVELTTTIGYYGMACRILEALQVELESPNR